MIQNSRRAALSATGVSGRLDDRWHAGNLPELIAAMNFVGLTTSPCERFRSRRSQFSGRAENGAK
jgi:hypothetical protein